MKMGLRLLAAIMLASMTGCASSYLNVEMVNRSSIHAAGVRLEYVPAGQAPDDAAGYLEHRMDEAFFGGPHPAFARGDDLTVRFRFARYQPGDQAIRLLAGTLAGSGNILIVAEFVDPAGAVVSRVHAAAEVKGWGLSIHAASDRAANQIRDYAVAQFRR